MLAQVPGRVGDVPTQPARSSFGRGVSRGEDVGADVDDPLGEVGVCLDGRWHGQQGGDALSPEVQALIHRPAARAGRKVKLRLPCLAPARQAERVAGDEAVAVRASRPDDLGELRAAGGEDPLDVAFDDPRRDAEVLGDRVAGEAVAVQHGDFAFALVEAVEDRERDGVELGALLTLDQNFVRRRRSRVVGLELAGAVVDEHLAFEPVAHVVDGGIGRAQQPLVDLAHRLSATGALGLDTGLLEGLLDLLARGAALGRGDLRAELRGAAPAGDLLEQRSGSLRARWDSDVDCHTPTRGPRRSFGPPFLKLGQSDDRRPVAGLGTHALKPLAGHVPSAVTVGS